MFIFIAKIINTLTKKFKVAKSKCDNPEVFEEVMAILETVVFVIFIILFFFVGILLATFSWYIIGYFLCLK